jgi:hypothetical protein
MSIRISINRQGINKNIRTITVPSSTGGGGGGGNGATTFAELTDVDVSAASNNEVAVYNTVTGKYEVKEIPFVDGGTF